MYKDKFGCVRETDLCVFLGITVHAGGGAGGQGHLMGGSKPRCPGEFGACGTAV